MKTFAKIIGGLIVLNPDLALAAFNFDATQPSNSPFPDLSSAIKKVFEVGIVIAGVIFLILFLIAGISYLTGAGNDEVTGKAKKQMTDAIIGLILTLAAWAIANFVYGKLVGKDASTGGGGTVITPTGIPTSRPTLPVTASPSYLPTTAGTSTGSASPTSSSTPTSSPTPSLTDSPGTFSPTPTPPLPTAE